MRGLLVLLGAMAAVGAVLAAASPGAGAPSVSVGAFGGAAVGRPQGITAGPDGAIWFTNEDGHSIGRLTARGAVSRYTDPSIVNPSGITPGPDGALWFLNGAGSIGRLTLDGVAKSFAASNVGSAIGIAAGPDGAMWFTTGGKSIGRITMDGSVSYLADPRKMRGTYGIATGPDGAVWFTNYLGSSVGRISVDGQVSVYADERIRYPAGITAGTDGALWFADDSGSIGRITTAGVVTSYGDPKSVGHPFAIVAGPDGALWATDRGSSIVRITIDGVISRYSHPTIRFPVGIAAGRDGALWFANYTGSSVGRLTIVRAKDGEAAPRLTVGRLSAERKSPVAHAGAVAVMRVEVRVDRSAFLTVTVRGPRGGPDLRLGAGSRVGAVVLRRPAVVVGARVSGGRAYVVEAVLPARELIRGRAYRLVLVTVGRTGKRSRHVIGFRG